MLFLELLGDVTWVAEILNYKYVKRLMLPMANDVSAMDQMIGPAQQAVGKKYQPSAELKEDVLGSSYQP